MNLLKVPMEFWEGDPEEKDKAESLGIPYKATTTQGFMYINTDNIVAFNEDSKGRVNLMMMNDNLMIDMDFDEFLEIVKKM